MPYLTGQRPPRRRRRVEHEDLQDMLNRPIETCPDCGATYWKGYAHVICTRRPKGEFL